MRGWVIGLAAVVILALGVAVAMVVAVTVSDSSTALVDLEPGMCLELPESAEPDSIEEVTTIECLEPHRAEVVAVGELGSDGRGYPADDDLFAEVQQRCRLTELVEPERYGLLPIAPTERLWESFDGRYVCIAIPFGGGAVTGSALAD